MAHRGNQALFPENTLSAFRQAVTDGADIIETDLQLTQDGAFLCLHDATIDRTTDGTGLASTFSLEQIRSYNAAARNPDLPPEPIPILTDLAKILPTTVMIALELKSDAFLKRATCHRLLDELRTTHLLERTVLLSFNPQHLATIRATDPTVPIGLITSNRPWPPSNMEMFGPYWPLLIINPLLVLLAHAKGQLVCPLDPTPDSRLWLYRVLGCDAILTDDPGKTARALGRQSS